MISATTLGPDPLYFALRYFARVSALCVRSEVWSSYVVRHCMWAFSIIIIIIMILCKPQYGCIMHVFLPAGFVQSGQESKLVDCRTGVYNLKTPLACTSLWNISINAIDPLHYTQIFIIAFIVWPDLLKLALWAKTDSICFSLAIFNPQH